MLEPACAAAQAGLRHILLHRTVQESNHLTSGAGIRRRKGGCGSAGRNAVLYGPQNRLVVVSAFSHIVEGVIPILCHRLVHSTPQESHHLITGAGIVRFILRETSCLLKPRSINLKYHY